MKLLLCVFLLFPIFKNNNAEDLKEFEKQAGEQMANGNYAEALISYEKAMALIEEGAQHPTLYAYAGICAQQSSKGQVAIEYFKSSIDQGIEEGQVFESLASIYNELGLVDKEEEVYQSAIKRLPLEAKTYQLELCKLYKSQKKYNALLSTASLILEDYPMCSKATEYKAYAYKGNKNMREACETYQALYKLEPENMNANMFLGNFNYKQGITKLATSRKKYDAIKKPTRVQWHEQNKKDRALMDQYFVPSTKHLEFVYSQKPNASMKKMLYAMYMKMGEREKAAKYKPE